MKKLLLVAASAVAFITTARADGLIHFLNQSAKPITLSSNGIDLGLMPGVLGQYRFELFVAPTGTTDPFQFTPTGLQGTNITAAGRFIGGNNLVVPGVSPGLNGAILVRGWSTSLGNDYSTAFSLWSSGAGGFLGESEIATPFLYGGDSGNGVIPTSPAFGGVYGIQQGFTLSTVPEPSSMALAGLGAASLLIFRRRKK